MIYFLIMGRVQLAGLIHDNRVTPQGSASRFLYFCYASSTAVMLFAVTWAAGWFETQTDATKRGAPRTRLLFWLVLADCALGAHNATAMAEYVQKPGNECGGLDVGQCLLVRYWGSTHLAFTLKWVATGYTVDVLFFPELFRSLLFVLGVCGVVNHTRGPLGPAFLASLLLRAAFSFCVTLTTVAVTGNEWATLERAGLDREELLRATCPSILWRLRDATTDFFNALGTLIRRTLLIEDGRFGLGRPTLPIAHLAVVVCIVLGRFSLHDIGRMQLSLFIILQAIELVGHGRMAPSSGGALDKQHDGAKRAIPGCDSPELRWDDVGVTGRVLGMGAHGSVYEARLKGTDVALKVWQDDAIAVSTSEAAILQSLRHPNVLNVFGVLRDPPALVTEMGLCSLQALLADPARSVDLTWRVRLSILRGIVAGCDFLHAHNPPIIHGDLKTSNIIMAPGGVPKLADFGSSFVAHRFMPRPLTGFSRAFAAPEVLQFLPVDLPTAVDVYSFGIVVLHVARVATAGGAENSLTFFDNTETTATWTPVTIPADLPRPLQAVVRECLAAKPEQRCTFRSLVATLQELDKKLAHG